MALVDNAWYINYGDGSAGAGKKSYWDVAQWVALTSFDCGALIRQLASPAVGSERVFVCIAGHVASGAAEPSWTLTRGAKTTDATITWMEATGIAALNGDLSANTPNWNIVKNTAITLGQVIQNVAGTLILICTTAGTAGNGAEPSWAAYTTAGATTADNTATWTTLGASYASWASPAARIANAFATNWGQANNKFFAADNHAETQASALTLTSPGGVTTPCFAYCVDRAGSVPPVSSDLRTTGTVTTTGANSLTFGNCSTYYNGLTFSAGSGAVVNFISVTGPYHKFENCKLVKAGTSSATNAITFSSTYNELVNTTMQFGNTGDQTRLQSGKFVWRNTPAAIAGATIPTSLVFNANGVNATLDGVDLSALGANTFHTINSETATRILLVDCKLGASMSLISGTPGIASILDLVACDSGATNYRQERYAAYGTQTAETTIVRTGGATDGTTPISWKAVTNSGALWIKPYESLPIAIWNDSTAAINSLTIYGTTTGGGVPNNDDIWVEVEYLGSGSSPQGSFITTTKANNLAASATTNNSADGSTWGGGGAGNGFKIVVPSFTPGMKGPINITIKAAKASATYYIDPRPSISGVTVSKSEILAPGVYANELQSAAASGMLFIPDMAGT